MTLGGGLPLPARAAPGAMLLGAALQAAAQPRGTTPFAGTRLTGDHQAFGDDGSDLGETRFGRNRAASVSVSPGCRVTPSTRTGFRGTSVEVLENDNDLGTTAIGRGAVSSIRVSCRGSGYGVDPGSEFGGRGDGSRSGSGGPGRGRGVTVFRDRRLSGPSQLLERDVPDLSRTACGGNGVSSVDVSPGCVATLHHVPRGRQRPVEHAGGRGHGVLAADPLRPVRRGGPVLRSTPAATSRFRFP